MLQRIRIEVNEDGFNKSLIAGSILLVFNFICSDRNVIYKEKTNNSEILL